jgi:hypothetical protein
MTAMPETDGPTDPSPPPPARRRGVLEGTIGGAVLGGLCLMTLGALAFDPVAYHDECDPQSTVAAAYHGLVQGVLAGAVLGGMVGAVLRGAYSAIDLRRGRR